MKKLKTIFENTFKICSESGKSGSETVAYIAGSFKPPHAGHFAMVKEYAKRADRVVIVVSNPKKKVREFANGKVLSSEEAVKIWQMFIEDAGMENIIEIIPANKIKVVMSSDPDKQGNVWKSPLLKIIALIKEDSEEVGHLKVILGISDKDFSKIADRFNFFYKALEDYDNVEIINPEVTAVKSKSLEKAGKPISATAIREHPENMKLLRMSMPDEISDEHFRQIYKILNPDKKLK